MWQGTEGSHQRLQYIWQALKVVSSGYSTCDRHYRQSQAVTVLFMWQGRVLKAVISSCKTCGRVLKVVNSNCSTCGRVLKVVNSNCSTCGRVLKVVNSNCSTCSRVLKVAAIAVYVEGY
jgi:hypothetical protein